MSDSLLKANRIVVKSEGKRVIDSNSMISERLRVLSEILERQNTEPTDADFTEGFVEGLDADQVSALFDDGDNYADGEFAEGIPDNTDSAMISANAQQIIDEANEEAKRIIAEAEQKAEDIVAGATSESGAIKQHAKEEGYKAGYDDGHNEGMAGVKQLEDDLNAKSRALSEEYEQKIDELEPLFVDNLTDIYSHIFNVDLSDKAEIALYLLKSTIRNIDGTKNFFVHVSKEQFEDVNAAKEDLAKGLGSQVSIEIIEDITLKESECFIEADSGIFDCSLGTELELLKKELKLLSYRKES